MAWTSASALWRSVSSLGHSRQLNGWKNGMATLVFLPVLLGIPWLEQGRAVALLLLSGVIGIAAGDCFYLSALRRLGTRRTLTVEACGPVLAGIGSVLLMREGMFNPLLKHRIARVLRHHVFLLDFLARATASHARPWLATGV